MSSKLPQSWISANLFDVCMPRQWKTISIGELSDSGYPVYGANGRIGFYSQYTHEHSTIMITCRGATCGNIHISLPFSYINGNAMALDELDEKICELKYLAHFLSVRKFDDVISGTAQPQITRASLSPVQFPLAPRAEQTRIVAKLEELLSDLDAGVAELKAAQKKLARYRQSLLKAAVEGALTAAWRAQHTPTETGAQLLQRILTERRAHWETKQLAKFKAQGKAPPKDWQKNYPEPVQPDVTGLPTLPKGWVWASVDQLSPDDLANGRSVPSAEKGAKVLRLTAVRNGRIDLSASKNGAWTEKEAEPFAVVEGDLLIVRGNGSLPLVGRAALVPEVREQVAYPDTLIRLRVVESVVRPAWICFMWDSEKTRTHLEQRARTSAGIYKISQPDIISVVVPVPPLAEQDQMLEAFAVSSQSIDEVELMIGTSLKQSTAQRQNILRAAFAGQLVPQDPNDEPASVLLERIRAERAKQAAAKKPRVAVKKPRGSKAKTGQP